MTERTRIGNSAFGSPGLFISQPGDSVASPSKALLLDSRYDALEIHETGRTSFPEYDYINPTYYYRRQISYSSLGYIPLFDWYIIQRNQNYAHYPPGKLDIGSGPLWARLVSTDVSNSSIIFEMEIDAEEALDVAWVIYRNPRTSPTLSGSGNERVFIGNDAGTFKMRVSKRGYNARSANRDQCLIHEDKRPLIPVAQGSVSIGAGNNATVNLGRSFAFPPKIICLNGDIRLNLSTGQMLFYGNPSQPITTRYIIYYPA